MSITTVNTDLSSLTVSDDGTRECVLPNHNPETLAPFLSEADVLAYVATIEGREHFWIPKLSDAEKAAVAAANTLENILRKRAAEYPPITDYLDGIVKGDAEQVQAYIDACLAVKAKYPKPDAP